MEKALTVLEAWKEVQLKHTLGVEDAFAHGFAAGRVGMIPESEAVRIPPVTWRDDFAVLSVELVAKNSNYECVYSGHIADIPRPIPAWAPKLDEPIFFIGPDGGVSVGKVNQETVDGLSIMATNGGRWSSHGMKMKPFNAAYIGKPWDEIPGGLE